MKGMSDFSHSLTDKSRKQTNKQIDKNNNNNNKKKNASVIIQVVYCNKDNGLFVQIKQLLLEDVYCPSTENTQRSR